jgi:hypothetical protein
VATRAESVASSIVRRNPKSKVSVGLTVADQTLATDLGVRIRRWARGHADLLFERVGRTSGC